MNQSFENPKTLFSVAIFFLPFSMDALELVTSSYNLKRKISSEKKKTQKIFRAKVKRLIEIETNTSII